MENKNKPQVFVRHSFPKLFEEEQGYSVSQFQAMLSSSRNAFLNIIVISKVIAVSSQP